jgi:DNA gyrase/topoisomerase IV subunit A
VRWVFKGEFDKVNATTIRITNLPYGIVHSKFISKLEKLEENGTIQEITDNSKNVYNIEIRFKKGVLRGLDDDAIMNLVGLVNNATENMNVIDFDGERVLGTDYVSMIGSFSDWRLGWYKNRYDRLAGLLEIDIQKYKDILQAIKKNVGGTAKKIGSRSELKDYLAAIDIVHIDYIADLPVYRFTEEERKKVEAKLADALKLMKQYRMLIKSEPKRRAVYIEELKQVRQNYKKGNYDIV